MRKEERLADYSGCTSDRVPPNGAEYPDDYDDKAP